MVWLNLKFNFKIVIISIQKSFLLLILIPFLSGLFHSYSNSISNSFPFLLFISVKKSFPFPFLFLFPFPLTINITDRYCHKFTLDQSIQSHFTFTFHIFIESKRKKSSKTKHKKTEQRNNVEHI